MFRIFHCEFHCDVCVIQKNLHHSQEIRRAPPQTKLRQTTGPGGPAPQKFNWDSRCISLEIVTSKLDLRCCKML